jgi:hypothetical protein
MAALGTEQCDVVSVPFALESLVRVEATLQAEKLGKLGIALEQL